MFNISSNNNDFIILKCFRFMIIKKIIIPCPRVEYVWNMVVDVCVYVCVINRLIANFN